MSEGEGMQWWWNMTEAQKNFWYAARERDTARALDRKLRAGRWFMVMGAFMLTSLWTWVIRVEAGHENGEIWVEGFGVMGFLTVGFIRGLWLYWVTYRDIPQRSDKGDGTIRKHGRNRGVDGWEYRQVRD